MQTTHRDTCTRSEIPLSAAGGGGNINVLDLGGEIALLPLPSLIGSYILWLIVQDLLTGKWSRRRKARLREEDVRSFALFLHDCLPAEYATAIPERVEEQLN